MPETKDRSALVRIAGNPAPAGLVGGYLKTSDRRRLRYAIAKVPGASRGTVILLQGRNEAIEKYFETIGDLNDRGFSVVTFDWRGQGGSERLLARRNLGHVGHFGQYLVDLECVMQDLVLPDCRPPYNLLAHSMGGLVALHASARHANAIERMVLLAPLIGFPADVPSLTTLQRLTGAARWLGLATRPVRRAAMPGRLTDADDNPLTSDPRRYERNLRIAAKAPELFVGSPTVAWLSAMSRAMARLQSSAEIAALTVPTLIVTAGADRVVASAAAERLAYRMRCGSSLRIPLARHELLQEADRFREQALEAFDAYVGEEAAVAAQ
ncbi:alpha/beta fold hydrolase [Jiella sonneratiae]|uniref:Alpha/beta hydrolase n=1 Tax=Jiella sonneratiae TaxID=2816856 RepID=A0ABS3J3F2_9HYPH|nr:alpha/beta hydrolase [Jiella sonneratiae]MBO0903670.1 alpha/beta hydrolase [Jiella sonneratiae]